jgi:hypothetical protein
MSSQELGLEAEVSLGSLATLYVPSAEKPEKLHADSFFEIRNICGNILPRLHHNLVNRQVFWDGEVKCLG